MEFKMKAVTLGALLVCFGSLAGCATSYQPHGLSGGFSETQLDQNVFRVSFAGNGYTSGERAADFALLRSAELTLRHGFTHFAIVDGRSFATTSTYVTPVQSYTTMNVNTIGNTAYGTAHTTTYGGQAYTFIKPSATDTIVAFNGKPDIPAMVYNARFICDSLGAKYAVTCGSGNR